MSAALPPPGVASVVPGRPAARGLAVGSLVAGIASLACLLGPLAGVPAIVLGHLARARIQRAGGMLAGGGLALAGLRRRSGAADAGPRRG